ncbi:MAG: NAD(P)-binding domain-containing protein [Cetobacterium sp.]|uniref:NAD(P)-binding domain-containing protein n=1 Tax=Cetobacterium sp. TaxID=2071632 RepID=UPI003EE6C8A8
MQKKDLNWGILGTGVVANEMAVALKKAGKKIYSVGNRTHSKALEFAQKYEIDKVYDNFNGATRFVMKSYDMLKVA